MSQTLSSLANIVIARIDFTPNTTLEEAVDFLNMRLRAPDPPPPKNWKLRLEVSEAVAKKRVTLVGENLPLHQIVGVLADQIGAEVVITRQGFTLREPSNKNTR